MSRDRFDVLERFAPLFETTQPSFEGFLRRRDRRRRNQRISAGVVAVAVFVAAVWIVTTGGPFHRTQMPAAPGPTAPPTPHVGLIGLAPERARPSSPEHGTHSMLRSSNISLPTAEPPLLHLRRAIASPKAGAKCFCSAAAMTRLKRSWKLPLLVQGPRMVQLNGTITF